MQAEPLPTLPYPFYLAHEVRCMKCKIAMVTVSACVLQADKKHGNDDDTAELLAAGVQLRLCPKCNTKIEKDGGCSSMDCYLCGHSFEWRQAKRIGGPKAEKGKGKKAEVGGRARHTETVGAPAVCRQFQRGRCTRGDACPYLHGTEPASEPAAEPAAERPAGGNKAAEVCRAFQSGGCRRGDKCPYLHEKPATTAAAADKLSSEPAAGGKVAEACRAFQKGDCRRGDTCPYLHIKAQAPAASAPAPSPAPSQATAAGGGSAFNEEEVCRAFQKGDCRRGDKCPYLHGKAQAPSPASAPAPSAAGGGKSSTTAEVCRAFLQGTCRRGDKCPYLHEKSTGAAVAAAAVSASPAAAAGGAAKAAAVCRAFQKGDCRRGDVCPYLHSKAPGPSPSRARTAEVCRAFQNGDCRRGDKCTYLHGTAVSPAPARAPRAPQPSAPASAPAAAGRDKTSKAAEVCQAFQKGTCRRDKCPYLHIGAAPAAHAGRLFEFRVGDQVTLSASGSTKGVLDPGQVGTVLKVEDDHEPYWVSMGGTQEKWWYQDGELQAAGGGTAAGGGSSGKVRGGRGGRSGRGGRGGRGRRP